MLPSSDLYRSVTEVLTHPQVLLGISVGLCVGMVVKSRVFGMESDDDSAAVSDEDLEEWELEEVKLVVVVRSDLKMGKGKAAAQVSHATLKAYKKLLSNNPRLLEAWERQGQPKTIVKVDNEDTMIELGMCARDRGLLASMIQDAGRTQVAPGSKTVLAVGPGPAYLIDEVTGDIEMY